MREALGYNVCPNWMLVQAREEVRECKRGKEAMTVTSGVKREKRLVVIPYIRGFFEELKRIFGGLGVQTYF